MANTNVVESNFTLLAFLPAFTFTYVETLPLISVDFESGSYDLLPLKNNYIGCQLAVPAQTGISRLIMSSSHAMKGTALQLSS